MKRILVLGLAAWALAASAWAEVRTWTDARGQTLEAEYVSHTPLEVTLLRSGDKRAIRVPLAQLSAADVAFVQAQKPGSGAVAASAGGAKSAGPAGEGIYLAVGNGLHRMASNDGIEWTNVAFAGKPAHDQNDLKALAFGNGVGVAVGGFAKSNILTTKDGKEWTINDTNAGVLSGVLFVDGRFYAFGEGQKVIESRDGLKWSDTGSGPADFSAHLKEEAAKEGVAGTIKSNIRDWRHANGVFVGCGDNGFLTTTKNFEKWTYPPRIEPRTRLYQETDGKCFVVRGDRTLHRSTDGVAWTDVTPKDLPADAKFGSLVHDGERFLVNTNGGDAYESADGVSWKEVRGAKFPGTLAVARPGMIYSFETYWKFTEELKYTTDGGKSWKSAKIPQPVGVTRVIFAEGLPRM